MKKLNTIFKLLLSFIIGYLLFTLIISFIDVVLLLKLSDETIHFSKLFLDALHQNISTYALIYLLIFLFNLIYSLISIKILNKNLSIIKRKDEKNEK